MGQVVRHYAAFVIGLIVTGLVGGWAAGLFENGRGGAGPTILNAASPVLAMLGVIICLGVGTAVAIAVARVSNSAVGLFVCGWGIAVLAMRTENIREPAAMDASLVWLIPETIVWAALLLASAAVVFRFGGSLHDIHPKEDDDDAPSPLGAMGWRAALGALVLIPIVVLLARTPAKGQVLGSFFVASMAAGMAGRLLSPHVQPILLFAAPCLIGAIGQVIGLVMLGSDPAIERLASGIMPALLLGMPADIAAASFTGVAIGLGMVKSILHEDEVESKASPAANQA